MVWAYRPSVSVARTVSTWSPADRSDQEKATAPVESAPWVENSPSTSEDQDRAMAVGRSSLSETVAVKDTGVSSLTTSPVVGEVTVSVGGVPTV